MIEKALNNQSKYENLHVKIEWRPDSKSNQEQGVSDLFVWMYRFSSEKAL